MSYKSIKIIIEDWCIHQSIKRPIPTIVISIAFTVFISMGIQFIVVDDDGPGISKNEYENVFKPFYKIDKGRADSKSSVGLGLSISSDIIKSHGGNIMLEKSKMNGLRVKIFLPV